MGLKDLGYKPREASTSIIMDEGAARALDEATAAYAYYRSQGHGDLAGEKELADALKAAEEAADEASVTFRFRAKPRVKVEALVAKCPPSTEELARWKQQAQAQPLVTKAPPQFDWYEFAPRLIAMSMVEPEASEAEVLAMWDDDSDEAWSDAVWEELWRTAWAVNQQVSTRPTFGNDSKQT